MQISKNLNAKLYKNLAEWALDVRTVWDNARTYNAPESEVYQAAERLSKMMETAYAHIQRSLEIPNYDPYHPKPQEWYYNTYTRNYEEYRHANPQAAQVISAPVVAGYDHYAVHSGTVGGTLPPPAQAKASPAPKKTRAAPPMASPSGPAAAAAYNAPVGATNNANGGANRKRKADGSEEFEMMHMAHTTAPPGQQQPVYGNGGYGNGMPAQQPMHHQQHAVQAPIAPVAQVPAGISPQQQERLQSRLEMLEEHQANEVIKILQIQPNAEGEFEILIENMPQETVRLLENYLVSVTGPF